MPLYGQQLSTSQMRQTLRTDWPTTEGTRGQADGRSQAGRQELTVTERKQTERQADMDT
ncbi:hypothetical protein V3C99_013107 [Haemonchus contortus]